MKPRQLLVYAPVIGRGGVQRLVERLVPAMLEIVDPSKWDVRVLSQPSNELGSAIQWPPGRFAPLNPDLMDLPSISWQLQYLHEASSLFYQQLEQTARPGDVVWLPHPWFTLRLDYSRLRTAPFHIIPTIHDLAFETLNWRGPLADGYRYEMMAFALFASRLVFSSDAVRRYAQNRYGFADEVSKIIYLGDFLPGNFSTNSETVLKARRRYRLPPRYYLAFHCSSPSKDLLTIIQALGILRTAKSPAFAPLVVAGLGTEVFHPDTPTNDEYIASVQRAIRETNLSLNDDIFILGSVDDKLLGGLYAGAAATITASHSEAGLSGTLFEAFSAKSPVVYSDIPQFTERLGVEKSFGLHFRKGSADDLARAIKELTANTDLTLSRVHRAHEFVTQRTWTDIAADYLRAFEDIASSDPLTLRRKRISNKNLPLYLIVSTRFLRFRVVRFLSDRALPRIRLSTLNRRMQAEIALSEVEVERNDQRLQLSLVKKEASTLERKLAILEQSYLDEKVAYYQHKNASRPAVEPTVISDRVQTIERLLHHPDLPLDVLSTFYRIPQVQDQAYRTTLCPLYVARLLGETPAFWDIRMALNVLSRTIQPRNYLEIGTRLGWSLSQVLANSPQTKVHSFDMWIEEYAGLDNPGPEFVRAAMSRLTAPIVPDISFISGNSHDTLPEFLDPGRNGHQHIQAPAPSEFDLVTVDGDHNLEGAWMDLMAVMPHIALGGAITFDDLELSLTNSDIGLHSETRYPNYYPKLPDGLQSLRDVWNAVKAQFPNFAYIETPEQPIAVGIGIRLS